MYELRIYSSSLHDFQILEDIQLGNEIPPPNNKAFDGAVFQQPVSGLGANAAEHFAHLLNSYYVWVVPEHHFIYFLRFHSYFPRFLRIIS